MIIYGFTVVIILISLWYKLILRKEVKEKKLISRNFKALVYYIKIHIRFLIGNIEYTEIGRNLMSKMGSYIINLYFSIFIGLLYILVLPIILQVILQGINNEIEKHIIYILIITFMLIGKMKEKTQYISDILKSYITNVLLPIEKNPQIITSNIIILQNKKWDKRKCRLFILCIILAIVLLFLVNRLQIFINYYKTASYVVCVFALMMWIVDSIFRKRKHKIIEQRKEIYVNATYFRFEESIERMCNELKIDSLIVELWEDDFHINAEGGIDKNENPVIRFTTGFMLWLENLLMKGEDIDNIFLVCFGHELAHIYYKDSKCLSRRVRGSCLVSLLIYVATLFVMYCSICFKIQSGWMLGVTLLSFDLLFSRIMSDKRYWGQIAELKADRLGANLCNDGKKAFTDFWIKSNKVKDEKNTVEGWDASNILYKYYKRYIENEAHPSINRRIWLVENRDEWKWWEYFEHALLIQKWRFMRKGWNGR